MVINGGICSNLVLDTKSAFEYNGIVVVLIIFYTSAEDIILEVRIDVVSFDAFIDVITYNVLINTIVFNTFLIGAILVALLTCTVTP